MDTAIEPVHQAARRPLTLFLWILVGYFLVDAVLRGAHVADSLTAALGSSEALSRMVLLQSAFQILFAVLEILITLQIFVRSIAARVFGTGLLGVQLIYSFYTMAFRSPDHWLLLDTGGRTTFLGQMIFLAVAIVLLNRRPCRQVLRH